MAGEGLLRFGSYEFNPETGELRKGGTPLKLPPQPAKVLAMLAGRSGELITREILKNELWGDRTVVDFDQGLNSCIRRIRAVLMEDADTPRYIETVPRRGYRFIAPVIQVPAEVQLPAVIVQPTRKPRPLRLRIAAAVLASAAAVLWFAVSTVHRPVSAHVNQEAYTQYRIGGFLKEEFRSNKGKSIKYYQAAIAHYPGYADAYAGLADAYLEESSLNLALPVREYISKAKSMALKSLELDPRRAAGHTALGSVLREDWEWKAAEQEFRMGIEMAPNDPGAHSAYSLLLSALGRHEESLREARRAVDLDPVAASVRFNLAHDLWMSRRYDDAIVEARRVLELHPATRIAYTVIAHCYAQKGMYPEAKAALREFQPNVPPSLSPHLAYVLALSGNTQDSKAILGQKQTLSSTGTLVQCYTALGELDLALDYLERAVSRHENGLLWAKVRPEYDRLRAQPRFSALLQKMGFTP